MSDFWSNPSSASILHVYEQRRLWRDCAGSPEPLLAACVISTIISWAGSFVFYMTDNFQKLMYYMSLLFFSPENMTLADWVRYIFECMGIAKFRIAGCHPLFSTLRYWCFLFFFFFFFFFKLYGCGTLWNMINSAQTVKTEKSYKTMLHVYVFFYHPNSNRHLSLAISYLEKTLPVCNFTPSRKCRILSENFQWRINTKNKKIMYMYHYWFICTKVQVKL